MGVRAGRVVRGDAVRTASGTDRRNCCRHCGRPSNSGNLRRRHGSRGQVRADDSSRPDLCRAARVENLRSGSTGLRRTVIQGRRRRPRELFRFCRRSSCAGSSSRQHPRRSRARRASRPQHRARHPRSSHRVTAEGSSTIADAFGCDYGYLDVGRHGHRRSDFFDLHRDRNDGGSSADRIVRGLGDAATDEEIGTSCGAGSADLPVVLPELVDALRAATPSGGRRVACPCFPSDLRSVGGVVGLDHAGLHAAPLGHVVTVLARPLTYRPQIPLVAVTGPAPVP